MILNNNIINNNNIELSKLYKGKYGHSKKHSNCQLHTQQLSFVLSESSPNPKQSSKMATSSATGKNIDLPFGVKVKSSPRGAPLRLVTFSQAEHFFPHLPDHENNQEEVEEHETDHWFFARQSIGCQIVAGRDTIVVSKSDTKSHHLTDLIVNKPLQESFKRCSTLLHRFKLDHMNSVYEGIYFYATLVRRMTPQMVADLMIDPAFEEASLWFLIPRTP